MICATDLHSAPVYELPFGKTKRWLSKGPLAALAGGWLLGNVTTVQSGPPFTVVTQTNTSNTFAAGALRANVVGDPNAGVQRNVFHWFNTAAFAQPAIYRFGNEGMGALRAPGLIGFDLSILRNIRVREGMALQFRGEFINALNHTNLGVPATSWSRRIWRDQFRGTCTTGATRIAPRVLTNRLRG